VTRALAVAALGAALALCAAAFGSPSLYVPGVALGALGLGSAVWVGLAARGAVVHRRVGPATVMEEEPYPLRIVARTGLLPAPGGELIEPLLRDPIPLAGARTRHVRVDVRFGRRGRRSLAPVRLVIRDPLGLAARGIWSGGAEQVLVLPRIEPVLTAGGGPAPGAGALLGAGATVRLASPSDEIELDSLRPYVPGRPASRIHWPTVARTGELIERVFASDAGSRPLVVLDPRNAAEVEDLDRAVRAAASLCFALAREGGCALLLPGERRRVDVGPDLRAWPALHARLALVDDGGGAPALPARRHSGTVLWVTAGGGRGAARAAVARGATYVVAPRPLPGLPAVFSVAGCTGQAVTQAARRRAA
jgi:uncharacterized protein (DUF58 family)